MYEKSTVFAACFCHGTQSGTYDGICCGSSHDLF